MSTFMFKANSNNITPVSNIFIEKYMPNARGEYVKVYLLGLKYCVCGEPGINSSMMASILHLLETDVINAWNYWNDENVIKLIPLDNKGNFNIQFLNLVDNFEEKDENVNLLSELNKDSIKGMLQDIEKLLGRTLSPKEMTVYIGWQNDFNFSPELILLLIQYCVSKGKTDYRYIEKLAIYWHDSNIKSVEDAQTYIKKHEDKWIKIRKILNYLGIKDPEVMKPQEKILDKWITTYNFSTDVILRACDICFERINKADFKYIDAILTNWFKSGIKTVSDVDLKDSKKGSFKQSKPSSTSKGNFNNYEQRNYDFDDLEKKLLGWDNND
ncbi:DNA replication protein DnaD [Clostridium sp. DMHC 10]|uniref:DnaD domain protein n=1 Tax=Clostridium sp. DMHC 10 TaxID=747377 RepID=UPI00069FBFCF|nr:DnaD domain protein [Clostridium sp. DMHC 10]KOF55705.1 DNA replication protein DnaD [Clostridium sp. DMHC 10]